MCAQRKLSSAWASARLIRVFAVCMNKAWVLSYPLSAQRRLWSDWADAQTDQSLRLAPSHFVGFIMRRLICVWLDTSWGEIESWLSYLFIIWNVHNACRNLFCLPLCATGRLWFMLVTLLVHLLYYYRLGTICAISWYYGTFRPP